MKERNISFEKIYRLKSDHIYSDKENLHKILFNLLSNAIKHTPDKGKITLHANQFIDKSNKTHAVYLRHQQWQHNSS
ncbi:MAG: hypothetical protein ACLVEU_06265 [Bacteroides cellulosilyticus]